ncbi:hypothetical protein [Bradyrhizobium sp. S3.9.1]|uniref:hypothetical protein n=1 Tax=Bradyrhizobium sp. S3.9.1 TaxID=3156431 RepID=UPI003390F2AD
MTKHDLTKSPDDCPHCAEGPISATREHFHLAAVADAAANDTPLPLYEQTYAIHRAQQPGAQQLPAAAHAPHAPKKATIATAAIYAARAKAAAGMVTENATGSINPDEIYASRRAGLERNQQQLIQSRPASTA